MNGPTGNNARWIISTRAKYDLLSCETARASTADNQLNMAICQDPLDPKESKLQKPRRSGADADVFNYLRSQIVKLCFLEPKLWSCKQLITMNTTKCVPYHDNKKGHLGVRLLWVLHKYLNYASCCLYMCLHLWQ